MKLKGKLALFLVVLIVTSLLAGCKSSKNTSATSNKTSTNQVVHLKAIVVKHALTKDVNKMEWLTKMEKDAGVEITWQQISSDWDQKKGTLLASGDIPDLIIGPGAITDSDFSQFPGLFQDLTPLIEKYAPNIQKMFSEHPELKEMSTQPDGKIYGLPKYQRFWPKTATRQYINKVWLNKLGLKEPTNWDELYNVLLAFKTKDPNGNGKTDEIPMDWAPGTGFFNAQVMLGGEGITLSGPNGFYVDNGVVKNFYIDERYKKLVEFLHKLWSAGLINPEVFTQDYTHYQNLTRSPDAPRVGFTFGWMASDRFGPKWASQYESLPPLKPFADYTGRITWEYDYNSLNYGTNMVVMSAKCKNKEAAMKFIDQFYNPVNSIQVLFGSIGPNIRDNGDGSYTVLPPKDPNMDAGTWKWTSTLADNGPMYISDSIKLKLPSDPGNVIAETKVLDPYLNQIDPKKDVWPGIYIKFNSADNMRIATLQTNLNNLTYSKWSQWIVKGGIDKEWNSYIEQCKKAGLDEITKIMQKYYDKWKAANN
ncbi:extracellular solute-binding protein [Caldanaerobius polysaccharolyticus]|uniref:extracellular solute-binding protein n=1 Tax=Caldanaerobius polysaccharolyticus TaxID=44256 RepID=UPI000AB9DB67|nr:extracellular solute-binding protein [Caldanaerobius polysaccharolyticus]